MDNIVEIKERINQLSIEISNIYREVLELKQSINFVETDLFNPKDIDNLINDVNELFNGFMFSRKPLNVNIRGILIYLILSNCDINLKDLAVPFYKKDHTTIIHNRDKIKNFINIGDKLTINNLSIIEPIFNKYLNK